MLLEIIIQTFLAFFSILFFTRILGRQQISQLTSYEYINGITFGSIAANLSTDLNGKTWQHFVGVFLFVLLTGLMSFISLKSRTFTKVIEGEPILVIKDGKILESNLKRSSYTIDELLMLLRQKDCFSPSDVSYAILETNGQLSLIKTPLKSSVTVGDLNLKPQSEDIPTEIIIGGQIIYSNLEKRKISGSILIEKLREFNISKISEVMFATVDSKGKMYVDKYKDDIDPIFDFSENDKGI